MTLQLYYFPTLNAHKVTIALEEMGLAYDVVMVNILKDEQFEPEFIAINPNSRIPALVDPDAPGGAVTVFESAAILQYLRCGQTADRRPRRLLRTGIGFGTRTFPGISNVLRLLAFEEGTVAPGADHVAQILFEVDDQSPEDLAIALDRLRAHPSVLDVLQTPAFGKKGRITLHIQILAEPADLENVFEACFSETTTLGLRYQILQRRILPRTSTTIESEGRKVRVKVAERKGGKTAKIEAEDLLNLRGGRAARERLKQQAENVVLKKDYT